MTRTPNQPAELFNHDDWSPDKGDRIFAPLFDSMGTVLEICPRLIPREVVAERIFYLVELDHIRLRGSASGLWREYKNDRTLLLREEMLPESCSWVQNRLSSSSPADD